MKLCGDLDVAKEVYHGLAESAFASVECQTLASELTQHCMQPLVVHFLVIRKYQYVINLTDISASNSFMRFWKCSDTLDCPNGSLLKQYQPIGVINVVSGLDSGDNGTCQKPLFVSSLLNTVAPASCARVLSAIGNGYTSLSMLSFNLLKSTHIWTLPDSFGTTTIPAHHSVGLLTFEMTPNCSMRCNSFLVASCSGMGMFLIACSAKGFASGFNLIEYSGPLNVPSPVKWSI